MPFRQMQRQHVTLHESLRTVRARVGLRALMRAHGMLQQRVTLRVTLVTLGTFEGLLARVQPDVTIQIGLLNEALFAMWAAVRPFARVRLLVTDERRLAHKRLLAHGTLPQIHAAIGRGTLALSSSAGDSTGAVLLQQRRRIEADLRANGRRRR